MGDPTQLAWAWQFCPCGNQWLRTDLLLEAFGDRGCQADPRSVRLRGGSGNNDDEEEDSDEQENGDEDDEEDGDDEDEDEDDLIARAMEEGWEFCPICNKYFPPHITPEEFWNHGCDLEEDNDDAWNDEDNGDRVNASAHGDAEDDGDDGGDGEAPVFRPVPSRGRQIGHRELNGLGSAPASLLRTARKRHPPKRYGSN